LFAKSQSESAIFVAPSGSVVQSFQSETPYSMNKKRTVVKSPAPLDQLLSLDRPPKAGGVTLSTASYRNCRIEVLEFAAAPGVLGSGLAVSGEATRQFKARGGTARTRGPHFVA
jgi:hypothetical protein